MTSHVRSAALGLCLSFVAACSSSGGGNGGRYAPCGDDVRVGQFALELKPALLGAPPYSQVNGVVRDSVDPKDVWQEIARAGGCRVMVGPTFTCAPACGTGMVCRAGACVAAPAAHAVGTVTMSGLLVPLSMTPSGTSNAYYGVIPTGTPFPPYDAGATVGLAAEGGDYAPFSLEARGVAPLELPDGQTLALATSRANQALTVRWTAANASDAGRVELSFDIAHHAGIAARLLCDVADTGTTNVPGSLLDALVARGTAGFPELVVTRVSADSKQLAPGCVELAIVS